MTLQAGTARRSAWLARSALILGALGLIVGPFLVFEAEVVAAVRWTLAHDGAAVWAGTVLAGLLVVDVVAPVPSSLVGVGLGGLFGSLGGTAVCWLGLTLGAAVGYALGRGAGPGLLQRMAGPADVAFVERMVARHGAWAIVAFRAVPVLAEASLLVAGCGRMRLLRFAWASTLANLGVAAVYANVGTLGIESGAMWLALAAAIALPGAAWLVARLLRGFAPWTD